MTATPVFTYVPAGRAGWIGWLRFKLKECWILVRLMFAIWPAQGRPAALHNSLSGVHFTEAFLEHRAAAAETALSETVLVKPVTGLASVLALFPALILTLLPVGALSGVIAATLRRRQAVVIYCDAQLSGFVLALACGRRGTPTATLHHGLYQHDHPVSMVGIANFVSDRAYLWNEVTRRAFRAGGIVDARLCVTGQYGWQDMVRAPADIDPQRVHICPPFEEADLPLYLGIATALEPAWRTGFSLHPLLRSRHARLRPEAIADLIPAPAVAICGDSGAIMDCLARGIPIVTIGSRDLAATHLRPEAAATMNADDWADMIDRAKRNLDEDRKRFGFTGAGVEPQDRSKEAETGQVEAGIRVR